MTKEQIEILKFYETVTAETGEDDLNSAINAVLAETEERKTGKWIKDIYGNVVCSECRANRRDNRIGHITFCNSCGAKMEVEE